jgi:hypothetical protein
VQGNRISPSENNEPGRGRESEDDEDLNGHDDADVCLQVLSEHSQDVGEDQALGRREILRGAQQVRLTNRQGNRDERERADYSRNPPKDRDLTPMCFPVADERLQQGSWFDL